MQVIYKHFIKQFGSSIGVIIPAEMLKAEEKLMKDKLKPGDIVEVTIKKLADGDKNDR